MKLYCQCGYPIRVAGHWTGKEYYLRLYDSEQGSQDEPITHCPRCGESVRPAELHWLPPLTHPPLHHEGPGESAYPDDWGPLPT